MKNFFFTILGTLAAILPQVAPVRATEAGTSTVNYARPFEPAVKPAFLPLPPGAVEPAGWLSDWAHAARQGITGHLD